MDLSFRSTRFTLGSTFATIDAFYDKLAATLPTDSFTGVKRESDHVFCLWQQNYLVSIFFPAIGARNFWQVTVCCGPEQATADDILQTLATIIAGLNQS